MIPIKFTSQTTTNFQQWINDHCNEHYSFNAKELFNELNYFTENFDTHYELPKYATKSGNPEIYSFDKSSFEYLEDENA